MTPQIATARMRQVFEEALCQSPGCSIPTSFRGVSEIGIPLVQDGTQKLFRVAVRSVTSDSRAAGEDVDRYRIQLTGLAGKGPQELDALLGLFDDESGAAFVLVDPSKHLPVTGGSNSVQFPRGLISRSIAEGRVVAVEHNDEKFIAFPPKFLLEALLSSTAVGMDALEALPREPALQLRRRVFQNVRDPAFRDLVLERDGHACVLCGTQMGVVEAAHIVAHAIDRDDRTDNGLSLCANHHAAYDRARIFTVSEAGVLHVNVTRLGALRDFGRLGGRDSILGALRGRLAVVSTIQASQFAARFALDTSHGEWISYDEWSRS